MSRKNEPIIAIMDGAPSCPVLDFPDIFWDVAERFSQLQFMPFMPETETWEMLRLIQALQSEVRRNDPK